jgi:hypothetical protein
VSRPRRTRRSREKDQRRTAIIHRTVRWRTGLSGEPTVACANGRPRNLHVTRGRANGRLGTPDCPMCTGQCPVRQPTPRTNGRMRQKWKEIAHQTATGTVRWCIGLHHPIKGKFGLPSWPPTAPSCLGAIKGTPRRMEEPPKHSLSILRHPDCAPTHSLFCVRDLSSIRVNDSLCCHLSSSLHLCAWGCCVFESCVCCSSQPYSVIHCDLWCKGERLQFVEIPHKREQSSKGKTVVFKLIIGSLERG